MATIPQDGDESEFWPLPRLAGALRGETEADNAMHAEARAALLTLLLEDPDVVALFDGWNAGTRAGQLAIELAAHLDRATEVAGFGHRGALWQALGQAEDGALTLPREVPDAAEAERLGRDVEERVEAALDLDERFRQAIAELEFSTLFGEAAALVRGKWDLAWPWLAWELARHWLVWLDAKPYGVKQQITYMADSGGWSRPAPAIDFRFTTEPGERIGEALGRFQREAEAAVLGPLRAAWSAEPIKRGYRTRPDTVRRWVEWWYRNRIVGESINAMAGGDYDGFGSQLRYGIRRAHEWLDLVNATWEDDDA